MKKIILLKIETCVFFFKPKHNFLKIKTHLFKNQNIILSDLENKNYDKILLKNKDCKK